MFKKTNFYRGGFEPVMTPREASQILGCSENAPKDLVVERYRHLMKKNHPDLGGSPFLSSKVNEARDVLLGGETGIATRAKKK